MPLQMPFVVVVLVRGAICADLLVREFVSALSASGPLGPTWFAACYLIESLREVGVLAHLMGATIDE